MNACAQNRQGSNRPVGMRSWRLVLATGLVALLAGCASPRLAATVTRFHQWPAATQGASYAIAPASDQNLAAGAAQPLPSQQPAHNVGTLHLSALEYQAYAAHLGQALQKQGLVPAEPDRARMLVSMTVQGYSTMVQERVLTMRPVLWMGYRGFFWRTGSIFYDPWDDDYDRDLFGWSERTVTRPVQSYLLRVKMVDRGQTIKGQAAQASAAPTVFDAQAQYTGRPLPLASVMPYLVRAVFADFPGANGQTSQVVFDTKTGEQRR